MEWAVQVGLNSYAIDQNGTTLGDVLSAVESVESRPRKLMAIYRHAPTLLDFDDAMTCEGLEHNKDLGAIWDLAARQRGDAKEVDALLDRIFWQPAFERWDAIQDRIVESAARGIRPADVSLRDLLGVTLKGSTLESYERAAGLV